MEKLNLLSNKISIILSFISQKFISAILSIPVIIAIISIIVILYYFNPSWVVPIFLFSIAIIPIILAYKITITVYRYSGYAEIVENRIYRRKEVGLAYICSCKNKKILLRKQTEEPFIGMWVLLGGYLRKGESFKQTIERRVLELTDGALKIKCQDKIAETNKDPNYLAYIISTGYTPAYDVLYETKKVIEEKSDEEGLITLSDIKEEDVKETPILRWMEVTEMNNNEEVLDTMKHIISALQKCREEKERPISTKYWKIDEEYLKKYR